MRKNVQQESTNRNGRKDATDWIDEFRVSHIWSTIRVQTDCIGMLIGSSIKVEGRTYVCIWYCHDYYLCIVLDWIWFCILSYHRSLFFCLITYHYHCISTVGTRDKEAVVATTTMPTLFVRSFDPFYWLPTVVTGTS